MSGLVITGHDVAYAALPVVGFTLAWLINDLVDGWHSAPAEADVDHTVCEDDDCDTVICQCLDGLADQPCPGTEVKGCAHFDSTVCGEHRLSSCWECVVDAKYDSGSLR